MMLTEATGNAECVIWNGAEFRHWLIGRYQQVSFNLTFLRRESGNRTYSSTASRMTSGLVLK